MDLKEQIVKVLQESNYSFSDLAAYLNTTEEKLDAALQSKSVDIRTLEIISKELRIPLYSFFPNNNLEMQIQSLKKHYRSKIKVDKIDPEAIEIVKKEIVFLKNLLKEKEEYLSRISENNEKRENS